MIYFAQAEGTDHVKIGFTAGDPGKRVSDLQTGCPHKLVLLATVAGGEQDEARWHEDFAGDRVRGEWFRITPRLLLAIARAEAAAMCRPPAAPERDPNRLVSYVAQFEDGRGMDEWKRTSLLDPATGEVYLPAFLTGETDDAAAMLALFDGVGLVRQEGHLYLPASWLARTYPDAQHACERAANYTRRAHAACPDAPEGS